MKGWRTELSSRKMLTVLFILLYCPFRLPFHFLTDHQIQILKKRNGERFPHFLFPRCSVLYLQDSTFHTFFHNNMEGSIRTITGTGHFASSTKTEQKKKWKKDTTLWQKVCCQTIHQIGLSSLRLQPAGKTCGLCRWYGTMTTFWNSD